MYMSSVGGGSPEAAGAGGGTATAERGGGKVSSGGDTTTAGGKEEGRGREETKGRIPPQTGKTCRHMNIYYKMDPKSNWFSHVQSFCKIAVVWSLPISKLEEKDCLGQ